MLGFLSPPKIPEPVKPDDFTAEERERLRGVVRDGDPLKDRRDQNAIDRLLTNSVTEVTGPTGAFTLAQTQHANDQVAKNLSEFLGQSSQMEEERRFQSEDRLGQLESERKRDLDEYDQQVASHHAMEEVARKNWQSGLLRAGVGLASVAIPGIDALLPGGEDEERTQPGGTGLGNMGEDAVGRLYDSVGGPNPSAIPSFGDMRWGY